jgi:hypothetical protein
MYRSIVRSSCWLLLFCLFTLIQVVAWAQTPDGAIRHHQRGGDASVEKAAPSESAMQPLHLDQARQLVENLRGASENVYSYRNYHIDWEPNHCSARTDCSSFITLLLRHTYGWTGNQFEQWMHSTYPTAATYHDAITERHRFKHILHMEALHPGDILAIKYTDHHASRNGVEDTGHIVLVAGLPRPELVRKSTSGRRAFIVPVIDSAASQHGPTDTRAKHTGGIGQGEIRLYADKDDRIIGYAWSTLASSKYYSGPDRDIVAGRLTDIPGRPRL